VENLLQNLEKFSTKTVVPNNECSPQYGCNTAQRKCRVVNWVPVNCLILLRLLDQELISHRYSRSSCWADLFKRA